MFRKALFPLLFLCLFVSPVMAVQVVLTSGAAPFSITVLESNIDRTLIEYRINSFQLNPIQIDGQDFHQVDLGRRAHHLMAGLPELPTLRESILIPDDAHMKVTVLESEYSELAGTSVAPSKGNLTRNIDPAMVAYSFDDFYGQDAWFPGELAKLDEAYIMRDHRGLVVEVNPFSYNPASETLRVYERVVIEVASDGPGLVNVLTRRPDRQVEDFQQLYQRHFLNFDSQDRYASVPEAGGMLVVYYDAFEAQIQPLVDWRNQMGIPTEMVPMSSVGSTGTQLKSYIQNYYDNNDLCYVLLVGDGPQIPYLSYSGGASDPSLSLLAGSDSYPEIFVGRFSAQNATEVTTQVTKTIEYERDSQAGASWYHKGMGVASAEGSGIGDDNEADWVHMNNIRADLLGYTYTEVDQIYDTNGGNASQVAAAVNTGRGHINYCGHGSTTAWSTTGFSVSHVNALTNDDKLPFIQSVACVNGNFPSATCFAEAWLRATHNGEPSGGVAMYASTINMSWAPPMSGQDEIVDLLVAEEKFSYGGLCYNGSCLMMDEYGGSGQTEFKCWHIFGDPALRVRTDTPTALAVSHEDSVDPDAASFIVDTEPGAMAALSYDGTFHGSAIADGSGEAAIAIVGSLPEDVDVTLTVSAYNKLTHVEALPTSSPLVPICEVTPSSLTRIMPPNEVASDFLHVHNTGMEGSMLSYAIRVVGLNSSWLSVPTPFGDVASGDVSDVEVVFDTADMADGNYVSSISVSHNAAGSTIQVPVQLYVSADGTDVGEVPVRLVLGQNHPNPFNPTTSIAFSLPAESDVRLEVFSTSGRLVRTLVEGVHEAGNHLVVWNGNDDAGKPAPSGIYFYRLITDEENSTKKMMLLK